MTTPTTSKGSTMSVQALDKPTGPDQTQPGASPARVSRFRRLLYRPEVGAFIGAVAVYLFFVIVAPGSGFATLDGTASWLDTAAELGVVAIPVAMLLIAGEFDLSIGSTIGAVSMIVAVSSGTYTMPHWASIGLAVGFALLVGLVNGLVTTRTRLPSFIVTLATQLIIAGAALGFSRAFAGTTAVSLPEEATTQAVFGSQLGPVHVSLVWWIGITVVAWWF